jgi:hypothetical protein
MSSSIGEKQTKPGKSPRSLKIQFTLFFIFFVIAIYSILIITSLQQVIWTTETIGAQLGEPIVADTAAIIDGDAFERLSKSLNPADPFYEETRQKMLAIKNEADCLYLYTMAPAEGKVFRYIIDGSAEPADDENFSPLGTAEDISGYIKPVLKAMQTKCRLTKLDHNAQWGWLVTVYAPILNSAGDSVGIIGCDFNTHEIFLRLWVRIRRQLILSAIFVAAGFTAYLIMVNEMNKQNLKLVELKNTAEAASAELKDERDTIAAMKDGLKVGLFFMDKNFIIQDQYSKFLETVLEVKKLEGVKFTELISSSIKKEDVTKLIEYFVLLFNRSSDAGRKIPEKMLEDLNPIQEMAYSTPGAGETKILRCNFVPVDRGNGKLFVLGNIQDITEEKKMQDRLSELRDKQ